MNTKESIEFIMWVKEVGDENEKMMMEDGEVYEPKKFSYNRVIELLQQGEAYKQKAKRLEKIIADFSLWLKANYKTMKIKDAAIYWKKLIEDYVFEGVRKVIETLSKTTEEEANQNKTSKTNPTR